jgi:hypothetical protein
MSGCETHMAVGEYRGDCLHCAVLTLVDLFVDGGAMTPPNATLHIAAVLGDLLTRFDIRDRDKARADLLNMIDGRTKAAAAHDLTQIPPEGRA